MGDEFSWPTLMYGISPPRHVQSPDSVLVTSSRQAHKHDEREITAVRGGSHLTSDRVGDRLLTVIDQVGSVNLDALGPPRCQSEPKESEPGGFGRPAGSGTRPNWPRARTG